MTTGLASTSKSGRASSAKHTSERPLPAAQCSAVSPALALAFTSVKSGRASSAKHTSERAEAAAICSAVPLHEGGAPGELCHRRQGAGQRERDVVEQALRLNKVGNRQGPPRH